MKSIKEYPKATKIEIPLTIGGLTRYFRIADSTFRSRFDFRDSVLTPLVFEGPRSAPYPKKLTTPAIGIEERNMVGTSRSVDTSRLVSRPRTLALIEHSPDGSSKDVLTLTMDVSGPVPLFVITLLVPVPELRDRTIVYIDHVRAEVRWQNTQPPSRDAETFTKGIKEMMLMKKALIDRGLAEDAAQDQAMRTLLPEGLARLLRPDSEGGSADARKRANLFIALTQSYIARHPE
jgi:hypothetical protein